MRLALFLIFFSHFSILAQDLAPAPTVKAPNAGPPRMAEVVDICGCGLETHYAGGSPALSAFVNDRIELPSDINWGNTSHFRIYVQFIVEKDGSISDLHIARTNFPEMNEVVLSVFREMKNWVAGEYYCDTVRTRVRVPVSLVVR